MRKTGLILAVVAASLPLAACGNAKTSLDERVEKSFRKEFVDNCVTSAVKTGAVASVATKLCSCTADKIQARYKGGDLLKVGEGEMFAAADLCMKDHAKAAQ